MGRNDVRVLNGILPTAHTPRDLDPDRPTAARSSARKLLDSCGRRPGGDLPRTGLEEVGTRRECSRTRGLDRTFDARELAGLEDDLQHHARRRAPQGAQPRFRLRSTPPDHSSPVDHNIDLVGAVLDRVAHFGNRVFERQPAVWKAARDRRHPHRRAGRQTHRRLDEIERNAHRSDRRQPVTADRTPYEPFNRRFIIGRGQRRQVDQRDHPRARIFWLHHTETVPTPATRPPVCCVRQMARYPRVEGGHCRLVHGRVETEQHRSGRYPTPHTSTPPDADCRCNRLVRSRSPMSVIDIAAVLVCLAAVFGLVNEHLLRLPNAIGLLAVTLGFSIVVKVIDACAPSLGIGEAARSMVSTVDFEETLMHGMLGFLLFAGALHVDFASLRRQQLPIAILATTGVLICTFVIGTGFWLATGVPFTVALVFGALISPTDPVAVLGILKTTGVPHALETKIAGESLFNDGIGVVVFLIVAGIAFPSLAHGHGGDGGTGFVTMLDQGSEHAAVSITDILSLFGREAVGGAVLGLGASWLVWQLTRRVDDYGLEVLLTLALVMGTYSLASALHMSGPIAVVVAGLLIGHKGLPEGMSAKTAEHVTKFWHLVDELLNAVLFLILGLELFVIDWANTANITAGLIAIPLVLGARLLAIWGPTTLMRGVHDFVPGTVAILTWGGLRGGISVALVLSLPESEYRPLLLAATYIVVIFSILVQGLTLGAVTKRALGPAARHGT